MALRSACATRTQSTAPHRTPTHTCPAHTLQAGQTFSNTGAATLSRGTLLHARTTHHAHCLQRGVDCLVIPPPPPTGVHCHSTVAAITAGGNLPPQLPRPTSNRSRNGSPSLSIGHARTHAAVRAAEHLDCVHATATGNAAVAVQTSGQNRRDTSPPFTTHTHVFRTLPTPHAPTHTPPTPMRHTHTGAAPPPASHHLPTPAHFPTTGPGQWAHGLPAGPPGHCLGHVPFSACQTFTDGLHLS